MIVDAPNIREINKYLANNFGKELDGRPRWRISWAPFQVEYRFGEFNEFSGKIFLRSWKGVKQTQKYPYLGETWILEKLVFFPIPDIPESEKGHYECVYNFINNGESFEPTHKEVIWLVSLFIKNPVASKTDFDVQEAERDAAELARLEDELGVNDGYIATMLHNKEAVIVP